MCSEVSLVRFLSLGFGSLFAWFGFAQVFCFVLWVVCSVGMGAVELTARGLVFFFFDGLFLLLAVGMLR